MSRFEIVLDELHSAWVILNLVEFRKHVACYRAVWSSLQVVVGLRCWNMFEFQGYIREGSAGMAVLEAMQACLLALDTVLGGRSEFLMFLVMLAAL